MITAMTKIEQDRPVTTGQETEMVLGGGLEPRTSEPSLLPRALGVSHLDSHDSRLPPELQELIQDWSVLDPALKAGILAIARSGRREGAPRSPNERRPGRALSVVKESEAKKQKGR